jgi:hypothetical protein
VRRRSGCRGTWSGDRAYRVKHGRVDGPLNSGADGRVRRRPDDSLDALARAEFLRYLSHHLTYCHSGSKTGTRGGWN